MWAVHIRWSTMRDKQEHSQRSIYSNHIHKNKTHIKFVEKGIQT